MFSGLLSVLGTMILAVAFSHLFFPIITNWTLRYFLPAIVIYGCYWAFLSPNCNIRI